MSRQLAAVVLLVVVAGLFLGLPLLPVLPLGGNANIIIIGVSAALVAIGILAFICFRPAPAGTRLYIVPGNNQYTSATLESLMCSEEPNDAVPVSESPEPTSVGPFTLTSRVNVDIAARTVRWTPGVPEQIEVRFSVEISFLFSPGMSVDLFIPPGHALSCLHQGNPPLVNRVCEVVFLELFHNGWAYLPALPGSTSNVVSGDTRPRATSELGQIVKSARHGLKMRGFIVQRFKVKMSCPELAGFSNVIEEEYEDFE